MFFGNPLGDTFLCSDRFLRIRAAIFPIAFFQ